MSNKTKKPFDVAAEISRLQNIKNLIDGKLKTDRDSLKFLRRYKQDLEIIFHKKDFLTTINKIRRELDIPSNGFDIFNKEKEFKDWLKKYKQKNSFYDFSSVLDILGKYKNHIQTDPTELLNFFVDAVINDEVDKDIYYKKDNFMSMCPSLEIYENYVNEKPFYGIFDFILFDDIFVPDNNMTALFDYDNHLTIAISANTTKRDLVELWSDINKWQKQMTSYSKNKKKAKKNLDKGLTAIKYDKETQKHIAKEGLEGKLKDDYLAMRRMDDVDTHLYGGEIPDKPDQKKDEKYKINRRKIKSRTKKLLGSK